MARSGQGREESGQGFGINSAVVISWPGPGRVGHYRPMTPTRTAERLARVRTLAVTGQAEQIRVTAKLSKGDAARAVGVEPTTIGRWERGLRTPTGGAALRYEALLDRLARQLSDGSSWPPAA